MRIYLLICYCLNIVACIYRLIRALLTPNAGYRYDYLTGYTKVEGTGTCVGAYSIKQ